MSSQGILYLVPIRAGEAIIIGLVELERLLKLAVSLIELDSLKN